MTRFSADWLSLREPFDHAARQAAPLPHDPRDSRSRHRPRTIVDLGCGTGANLRHLAPRLGGEQHWTLLDHDPDLLAQVAPLLHHWAQRHGWHCSEAHHALTLTADRFVARVTLQQRDLALDPTALPLAGVDLVTTAALLDLVSTTWLRGLVSHCAAQRAAVHWALNYDGQVAWQPADAADAVVTAALNRHQLRDKGFGPALGPAAAACAAELLRGSGMALQSVRTDWLIGNQAQAIQHTLVDGWLLAALETSDADTGDFDLAAWARRRHRLIDGGHSSLRVGHLDVIAQPPHAPADAQPIS